jgi:hypothetical protein
MDSFVEQIDAWLMALLFALAMAGSWTFGWWKGRRMPPETGEDPAIKFTDASVVLLGLLLAFTFSIALARHEQRRLAVVAESNALGDFYTCASLLKEPHRSRLQDTIREYAQRRLDAPEETLSGADAEKATRASLEAWARMTDAVDKAIADGTPIAVLLTNTLNEVTASGTSRFAAYQERLPWSVVGILFASAVVPAYLIGEKQGESKKVHLSGTVSFIVLVALVVLVTLDLNQSHRGLITVSQDSLRRVIQSMAR